MKLMIVESPNKVKKIRTFLGAGWEVAASVGHIRDLPNAELGVHEGDYKLNYVFTERGKDVVQDLRKKAARAETVYLATDPDREGEAISWHLAETLELHRYERVTFDAITPDVVQKALQKPRRLDYDLVHAQEARRCADRLVGYKVSPALSRQTGIAGMSAGRVQTVAVRLVVERQREIQKFQSTKHFGAEAIFEDGKWSAHWDTKPHLKPNEKYILDSALAERAALCLDFRVVDSSTKSARQSPPAPFTTATLLQAASVSLGFKPDQTATLAQKLFEQGLITYHRTDSQNFSEEALEELREFAKESNLPLPPAARTWKTKDGAQEAHEAIRPTHLDQREAGEDEYQKKLYALIWNRAVASQLADAEYNVNTLQLETHHGSETFIFKAVGRTLTKAGWRILTAKDAAEESDDNEEDNNGKVPSLPIDTALRASATRVLNKQTKPPAAYTQASLIKKLESEGIGRPSTYPSILKNIITRGYIVEGKKLLSASDLAYLLIDSLVGKFRFVEYDYTRTLEQQLDDIAAGKAKYLAVVSSLDSNLDTELGQLQISPHPNLAVQRSVGGSPSTSVASIQCPKCKTGHLRRPKGRDFYSCDQYRNGCTFSLNLIIAKKKLTDKQIDMLCSKGKTGLIKGFINKQDKPFDAYLMCNADTDWKTKFIFD